MALTRTPTSTTNKTNNNDITSKTTNTDKKKLYRSESLERIKQHICSQNFFILPALISWLRAPHDKLQQSIESLIAIIKSILFSTFLPRLAFKLAVLTLNNLQNKVDSALDSIKFIKFATYLSISFIYVQLVVYIYYLSGVMQLGGFAFMIVGFMLITQINYICVNYAAKEVSKTCSSEEKVAPQKTVTKRLSRKDLLKEN